MKRSIRAAGLSAALVLALGTTGCGGEDEGAPTAEDGPAPNGVAEMTPAKALKAAIKAHRRAKDLVYEGNLQEPLPGLLLPSFAARVTVARSSCEIVLTSPDLGRLATRIVKDTRYSKGSDKAMEEALQIPPSAIELIDNRWFKEPVDKDVECDPILALIADDDFDAGSCQAGGEGEVAGAPTAGVRCVLSGGIETRFQVATTGTPYVLRMERIALSGDMLELVEADSGVGISVPPKREVLDTEALQ